MDVLEVLVCDELTLCGVWMGVLVGSGAAVPQQIVLVPAEAGYGKGFDAEDVL